jgi:hypothetical protein
MALQVYTEKELTEDSWKNITSFPEALDALNIGLKDFGEHCNALMHCSNYEHLLVIYKLDIIRKALNGDYTTSLVEGTTYYPWVKFYENHDKAIEVAKCNNFLLCGTVKVNGTDYFLVGGDYSCCHYGLGFFSCGYGEVYASLGLLCCKSKEIARHMSKYFAKEIFDAIYIQHNNYKWTNEEGIIC